MLSRTRFGSHLKFNLASSFKVEFFVVLDADDELGGILDDGGRYLERVFKAVDQKLEHSIFALEENGKELLVITSIFNYFYL